MPVLANNVSLTAGSSSSNLFDNTNYQFINEGTALRIYGATVGANDGVSGSNLNYRFTINNTEFADNAVVPALVTGQPFTGVDGGPYLLNSVIATGQARNRPLLVFRNETSGTLVVKFFIFILIFVFDPLAVMLVVAFNQALILREEETQSKSGKQKSLLTKKAKNWWEVYGETKDKILKREDIVEPEEEVVEVIKEDKTSENKKRNPLRGGVKT